jgi:hypothetical protein
VSYKGERPKEIVTSSSNSQSLDLSSSTFNLTALNTEDVTEIEDDEENLEESTSTCDLENETIVETIVSPKVKKPSSNFKGKERKFRLASFNFKNKFKSFVFDKEVVFLRNFKK